MIAQWYVEAGKYNVLPVDGRGQQRFAEPRPLIAVDRTRYIYYPGTQEVPQNAAPRILNRPPHRHRPRRHPRRAAPTACSSPKAASTAGFAFFVQDGQLRYTLQLRRRPALPGSLDGASARRPARPQLRVRTPPANPSR